MDKTALFFNDTNLYVLIYWLSLVWLDLTEAADIYNIKLYTRKLDSIATLRCLEFLL